MSACDHDPGRAHSNLALAPDLCHTGRYSGGSPLSVALPNPAIDGPLISDDWDGMLLVEYLRRSFAWGGFAGLEGHSGAEAAWPARSDVWAPPRRSSCWCPSSSARTWPCRPPWRCCGWATGAASRWSSRPPRASVSPTSLRRALLAIGRPQGLPALQRQYQAGDSGKRALGIRGLGRHGTPAHIPLLEWASAHDFAQLDQGWSLAEEAERAIVRIRARAERGRPA